MTVLRNSDLQNATLFISDSHLGGFSDHENQIIENDLIGLLERAIQYKMRIIILGDLLDYFLKHGNYVPDVGKTTLKILSDYSKTAVHRVLYITGNHDNWDEGYFDSLGFETIYESAETTLGNRKLLILHGDGLNDPHFNFPRPFFHRFLRNPYFIKVFKTLTNGPVANRIMFRFSNFSRLVSKGKTTNHFRVDAWARRYLQNNGVDMIVCGHHHHKRFEKYGDKLYVNLGAFFLDRTCAVYTNNDMKLVKWQNDEKKFWIISEAATQETS